MNDQIKYLKLIKLAIAYVETQGTDNEINLSYFVGLTREDIEIVSQLIIDAKHQITK